MTQYNQVLNFALNKHKHQLRKSNDSYDIHLKEVAEFVELISNELIHIYPNLNKEIMDMQFASLLHDTIEDTDTTYDDIKAITSEKVANWVATLSEDLRLERSLRKENYRNEIINSCIQVKIIKLADIYSNLKDIGKLSNSNWIDRYKEDSKKFLECLSSDLSMSKFFDMCMAIVNE